MNVFLRLEMIFESVVGKVLILCAGTLLLLIVLYLFLRLRQRSRDALAHRFQAHYELVGKLTEPFTYLGRHRVNLFGRETIVQNEKDAYLLCTAPTPLQMNKEVLQRFERYYSVLKHQKLPVFSEYSWVHHTDFLVLMESPLVRKDGRKLTALREYMLDTQFGLADAELILLEIAKALAALHELSTDRGERLYYGMLLPRNIFLDFDDEQRISRVVLPHHGLVFALGPKKVHSALMDVDSSKTLMGPHHQESIRSERDLLAPEQLSEKRFEEVGQASDYAAFGRLAVLLMTHELAVKAEDVSWEELPKKWEPFIRACYADQADDRPLDFLELQDRLFDPDLALTHHAEHDESGEAFEEEVFEEETVSLDALAGMLQNSQAFQAQAATAAEAQSAEESPELLALLEKVEKSLRGNRWSAAKKQLEKASALSADHPRVLVGFAICAYEAGEFEEAEALYERAKTHDPAVAKRFREHIAFRV